MILSHTPRVPVGEPGLLAVAHTRQIDTCVPFSRTHPLLYGSTYLAEKKTGQDTRKQEDTTEPNRRKPAAYMKLVLDLSPLEQLKLLEALAEQLAKQG